MQTDEVIQAIIELCRKYGAREAILFGSRAKGTELERSDYDIAVSGVIDFYSMQQETWERDLSDSFVLSGTSAKFSITFDLAWKSMKDILIEYYAITDFVAGSPREVLRKAFQAGMIEDGKWMQMLEIRNRLLHDYDGEIVKEYCQVIVNDYMDCFLDFLKWVRGICTEG